MGKPNSFFLNIKALRAHLYSKKIGSFSLRYQHLKNYEGVVFYIGFYFNTDKNDYQLNLEWMCLGLDLFGDNLVESVVYKYNCLEGLLKYLEKKHQIKTKDINPNYKFEDSKFPNPIKNKDKKEIYTKNWNQFQKDFKSKCFLDTSQVVIYNSIENNN